MTDVFLTVFEISVSISILIAVLVLLSPFLSKRYAAKWKCWIWIFLALRLIIPFRGTDVISMLDSWSQPKTQFTLRSGKSGTESFSEQTMPQGRIMVEIPAQMTAPIGTPSEKSKGNISLLDVTAFVWMIGSLAVIAVHLISYVRYKRHVLKRGTVVRDNDILRRMFELKHELRIKDTVYIIEYPEAASPMILGFLEPVMILPEVKYSSEELYFILKHELIHLKRRDVYIKLLLAAAGAVHWFNPLVWIMQKEAAVDMELSCDERVTQGTDYEVRKAYTETLLSTLHKRCAKITVLSTQFYGGKRVMKKRFKNILIRTGKKNGAVVFLCAVMLTGSLGTLVGCSVTKENTEDTSGQSENGNGQSLQGADNQTAGVNASNTNNDVSAQQAEIPVSMEKMVYIEGCDGEKLIFDEVEWVQVPGERAAELGITEDDAPSGFSVYNEEMVNEEMTLANDCTCTLLDWTSNYVEMQVTPEELTGILTEREGMAIPYHVTIRNNEIISITEQYIP